MAESVATQIGKNISGLCSLFQIYTVCPAAVRENAQPPWTLFLYVVGKQPRDLSPVCACYRPLRLGPEPLTFLHDHFDGLVLQFFCKDSVAVGDLNQYLVARALGDLLDACGLANHVDFPIQTSGSSLHPVITNLPVHDVICPSVGLSVR